MVRKPLEEQLFLDQEGKERNAFRLIMILIVIEAAGCSWSASFPMLGSLISVNELTYSLPANCCGYNISIALHTGYNERRNELVI